MALLSLGGGHPAVPPRVPNRGPSSASVMPRWEGEQQYVLSFNIIFPSNLKPMDPRQCYENNDTLRRVRHSKDNVPLESIKLTQVRGHVQIFLFRYV